MNSSVLAKFDKVKYYDKDGYLLFTKSIIYSNEIKNEMLGMMNADFADEELPIKPDLIEDVDLSEDELEVLAELSLYQSDYEPLINPNKYDSYSTSLGSKLTIIRAPKECVRLKLINTKDNSLDSEYLIDLKPDNQYTIDDLVKVEKMIIITQSGESSYVNPSVLIHENSNYPHSDLNIKILIADEFFDTVINNEVITIDNKVIHTKSNTVLGIDQDPYFNKNLELSSLMVGSGNQLFINNKLL